MNASNYYSVLEILLKIEAATVLGIRKNSKMLNTSSKLSRVARRSRFQQPFCFKNFEIRKESLMFLRLTLSFERMSHYLKYVTIRLYDYNFFRYPVLKRLFIFRDTLYFIFEVHISFKLCNYLVRRRRLVESCLLRLRFRIPFRVHEYLSLVFFYVVRITVSATGRWLLQWSPTFVFVSLCAIKCNNNPLQLQRVSRRDCNRNSGYTFYSFSVPVPLSWARGIYLGVDALNC